MWVERQLTQGLCVKQAETSFVLCLTLLLEIHLIQPPLFLSICFAVVFLQKSLGGGGVLPSLI